MRLQLALVAIVGVVACLWVSVRKADPPIRAGATPGLPPSRADHAAPERADPQALTTRNAVAGIADGGGPSAEGVASTEPPSSRPRQLEVEMRDGAILVDGVDFWELDLSRFALDEIRSLRTNMNKLHLPVMREVRAASSEEAPPITQEEYEAARLWHSETMHYVAEAPRGFRGQSGSTEAEDRGDLPLLLYYPVSRTRFPEAYTIREAQRKLISSPAYMEHIAQWTSEYERKIFAEHPHAAADVSSDLSTWAYIDPDGSIVGWTSFPVNGNN